MLLLLALSACDPPPAAVVAAEPVPAPPTVVVSESGERLSPAMERAVADGLHTLANTPAEPVAAADRAAAKDPAKLLGRWQIVETRAKTDGVASEPSQPLMPTAWVFTPDGGLKVDGGMQIQATYTYTGEKLVVSGMGPVLDYQVVRLTDTELEVNHRIEAGSLVLENATVLRKVP